MRKPAIVLSLFLLVAGCAAPVPMPTLTPMPTATVTQTPTPAATLTPQASATPTFAPVPTPSLKEPGAVSLAAECRAVVDGFASLKKDVHLPEQFDPTAPLVHRPGDFDPNRYFTVLHHLNMKPGYKLDYVYFGDELGGKPVLYARRSKTAAFTTYDQFLKSFGDQMSGERSYGGLQHAYDFLDQVQVDATDEGYLDFIVLALLGDQFYLFWHGLYNDTRILCDPSDADGVKADVTGSFALEVPQELMDGLPQVDYEPRVLVTGDRVTLRLATFSKWGGVTENIYVLQKGNPIKLMDSQFNTVLEYNCGVAF